MNDSTQKSWVKDGVVQYQVLSGQSDIKNNPYDNSVFYPFDGEQVDEEFSEIGEGIRDRIAQRRALKDKKKQAKIGVINAKAQKKAAAGQSKILKGKAKLSASEAQNKQAIALGKSTEGDVALANALAKNAPKAEKKDKTMLIVGISVGVFVLAGIGYYFYKKNKK